MACSSHHTVTAAATDARQSQTAVAYRADTVRRSDSVYVRDSISLTHWGDTVRIDRLRTVYRDRWQTRVRVDTVVRTDTLVVLSAAAERTEPVRSLRARGLSLGLPLALALIALLAILARVYIKR